MVRWLRWHCPPDAGFEIRSLAVWGRARYLSVTEAPHNTDFHTWMGKKQFCFFQTAETGNRTPDSSVKGSGANHYPRAPARVWNKTSILLLNVHQCQCGPADTRRWINVGLTLVHRLRSWTNVKPALIQRLVSAGFGCIPVLRVEVSVSLHNELNDVTLAIHQLQCYQHRDI